MSLPTPLIDLAAVKPRRLLPFQFRRVDEAVFLSNDLGEWALLSAAEFSAFVHGTLSTESARFVELCEKGFVAGEMDEQVYRERYWSRRQHVMSGPTLHAFVLTARCNHGCQYCHSSVVGMGQTDTDMSVEMAEKCVDFALQTTSPGLTMEFQGGEPMANWETLSHVVRYATARNRSIGKDLSFSLVSTLSLMTEERLDFLLENRVQICTSIDGPRELHNRVRIYKEGDSWERTTTWLRRINERYQELGLDPSLYRVEALPTITRYALPHWKEIVDTYVELGCRAIFLRILDPFGFAAVTHNKLGYSIDEFLAFYTQAFDYIVELNKRGVQVMERLGAIMLSKMMGHDPNYLDLRSPGGSAIGQIGYHPNGSIYSSDEGRMVAAMGDDIFRLGHVDTCGYRELMSSKRIRALVLSSTNDALPGCVSCAYKPYCGQQPEYNYFTQGSIQGRMPESGWCQKHKGIFDHLVRRLRDADSEEMAIFERWTINRRQEYFLQPVDAA